MPIERHCRQCGKREWVKPSRAQRPFCSKACWAAAQREVLIQDPIDRFWSKIRKLGPDDCWEWQAGKNGTGYGWFHVTKRPRRDVLAHRFSYELHFGTIPNGLYVCHKCDNRLCVNPAHFFLGTHEDNVRDMWKKGRGIGFAAAKPRPIKLNENAVREIRRATGTCREIGLKFGVAPGTVSLIKLRKSWAHLPDKA